MKKSCTAWNVSVDTAETRSKIRTGGQRRKNENRGALRRRSAGARRPSRRHGALRPHYVTAGGWGTAFFSSSRYSWPPSRSISPLLATVCRPRRPYSFWQFCFPECRVCRLDVRAAPRSAIFFRDILSLHFDMFSSATSHQPTHVLYRFRARLRSIVKALFWRLSSRAIIIEFRSGFCGSPLFGTESELRKKRFSDTSY